MEKIFFDNWNALARTAIIGVLAYASLIIILRLAGNRTLSKMNAFDLIITVSLGSSLATILLNKDVSLAQGTLALFLLVFLQFLITWSSVRFQWIRHIVTGEPVLLLFRGELLASAQRKARVTDSEIESAIRSAGLATLEEAHAVVLETDGSFSVVPRQQHADFGSLAGIEVAAKDATEETRPSPASQKLRSVANARWP